MRASFSFLPKNNELNKKNIKCNQNKSIIGKNDFNAFNSALFISEFQRKEENSLENKNKENLNELTNSNKIKESNRNLKFTYSFENCLTNELLDTIAKDSNSSKKDKKINEKEKEYKIENKNKFESKNASIQGFLKIKRNLLFQPNVYTKEKNNNDFNKLNENNINALYKENINNFEYQLKFIEDSLHNVLPKSYEKTTNSNNYYNNFCLNNNTSNINKDSKEINFFSFRNLNKPFNNNYGFVSAFDTNNNNENSHINSSMSNNIEKYYNNNNKIKYQIHQLNFNNSKIYDWKCNHCNNVNMGYRKTCINCRNNKKAPF